MSSRLALVWTPTGSTAVRAGYPRYFTPPPFELVGGETDAKCANTSAAAAVATDDVSRAERANAFDLGIAQKLLPGLSVGLDSYYKHDRNLIDEGQFGAPIILTPFDYASGRQYGAELSLPDYVQVNLGVARTGSRAEHRPADVGRARRAHRRHQLLDEKYEIRDGTGVGVGAPQYGPRCEIFAGLTKRF